MGGPQSYLLFFWLCFECTRHILSSQLQLHEATLAEVLQLYQYKDQVNADYQKSLLASLTNASVEKALLHDNIFASKQIISKLSQEIYCVRPALEAVREKYASALKTIEENEKEFKSLEIKMEQVCYNMFG